MYECFFLNRYQNLLINWREKLERERERRKKKKNCDVWKIFKAKEWIIITIIDEIQIYNANLNGRRQRSARAGRKRSKIGELIENWWCSMSTTMRLINKPTNFKCNLKNEISFITNFLSFFSEIWDSTRFVVIAKATLTLILFSVWKFNLINALNCP